MSGGNNVSHQHQAALIRLGRLALEVVDLTELLQQASHIVAAALGVDFCTILELQPDRANLRIRAGVGWREGVVGQTLVPASSASQAGHTLVTKAPVILDDFGAAGGFPGSPHFQEHGVKSGVSLPIPGGEPFGVLTVHTSASRTFSAGELTFLEAACEILGRAVRCHGARETVNQRERQFRGIFEDSPIGMVIFDLNHRFVHGNRTMCELLDYGESEFGQLTLDQVLHPGDRDRTLQVVGRLFRGEMPQFTVATRQITRNGQTVWVRLAATLIRDDQGEPLHAVGMVEDVTERQERGRDLRRARFTVEHAQDVILWMGADGQIRDVNESGVRMLGYAREELLTMRIFDVDENIPAERWPRFWRELSERGHAAMETRLRPSAGESIPVTLNVNYWKLSGEEYACAFARDVSVSKRAEKELKASEERYRNLFENAAAMVWTVDLAGNLTSVNRTTERIVGYRREEIVGSSIDKLLPPDQLDLMREMTRRKMREGGTTTYEIEFLAKDGTRRPVQVTSSLIEEGGKAMGVQAIGIDISGQRHAQTILLRSAAQFQAVIENGMDLVAVLNADGTVFYVSPSVERMLGYEPEERIGKSVFDIVHPDDLAVVRDALTIALRRRGVTTTRVFRVQHKRGSWRHLEAVGRDLLDNPAVAGIVVNARDVTGRKEADDLLRQSEQRFRLAAESTSDFIYEWDLDSGRVDWFGEVDQCLGYGPGLLPRTIAAWKERIHPDDAGRVAAVVDSTLTGATEPPDVEYRIRTKKGDYRYWLGRGRCLRDETGKIKKWIGACTDITHRREGEVALRRSESELRALAAKLLIVEEEQHRSIARELHDDYGQRLTALCFDLAALEAQCPPGVPDQLKERLHRAHSALIGLSDDVRGLARQLHPAAIELLGLVPALRSLCEDVSRRGFSVGFRARKLPGAIPPDLAVCLYRVTQEALRNAAVHAGCEYVRVTLGGAQESVRLSISDDGIGFDTAAAMSKGGLGLISMRERVRLVHGTLTLKSRPGKGTRIILEAPLAFRRPPGATVPDSGGAGDR